MGKLPSFEHPVVVAMYEAAARNEGRRRHYLGMSMLGDPCPRKIWFSFMGYTPSAPEGRVKMIFDLGDRVEDAVVKWLELAGYPVHERQKAFSDFDGYLRGHWDGCIDGISSKRHVLEIKSANASRFKAFIDKGVQAVSPTYWAQAQLYMGYSGLERALFVIMNKDDCRITTERLHFDRSAFAGLVGKAKDIIYAPAIPDKPANLAMCNCDWCDYRHWCGLKEGESYVLSERACGTCYFCHPSKKEDGEGDCLFCFRHEKALNPSKWGAVCSKWEQARPFETVVF